MRIGQLATLTGVPIKTIRYYETIGALAPPPRDRSGYRNYDKKAPDCLRFIKAAQKAVLSLQEIRGIFDVRDRGKAPCKHVAQLIDQKLAEIRDRIQAQEQTRQLLERLAERANRLDPRHCGADSICQIIAIS